MLIINNTMEAQRLFNLRTWIASVLVITLALANQVSSNTDVHIAFLTDCTMYSDWQTVGMAFSYAQTRQPGRITRIMCCTDEERARYNKELLNLMPTHVAPSFAYNAKIKDDYAAYNKPGAVVDWLSHVSPEEHWALVLDSDMYLRKQFHPDMFNASLGWAVSADYTYLVGVANGLWKNHIPHIGPRNDSLAGPVGRHADQVGGFFFIHRDDLAKMAPQWLSITERVRVDPDAWRLSGDQYVEKGGKPWISEMYGYVFAAANNSVWHKWDTTCMHYPNYAPTGIPKVVHYGLFIELDDVYKWDKHWYYDFDVTKCPPWDLKDKKKRTGGIFPNPPRPREITDKNGFIAYYKNLIITETVITLNAGFCHYHLKHCPPSEQLLTVCAEVLDIYLETAEAIKQAEGNWKCSDGHAKCKMWADSGECKKNEQWMKDNCKVACDSCSPLAADKAYYPPSSSKLASDEMKETLAALKEKLHPQKEGGNPGNEKINPDQQQQQTQKAPEAEKANPDKQKPTSIQSDKADADKEQRLKELKAKMEAEAKERQNKEEAEKKAKEEAEKKKVEEATKAADGGSDGAKERHAKLDARIHGHKIKTDAAFGEGDAKLRKDYMLRCYRMALSLDEVKDCVEAAKKGEKYEARGGAKEEEDVKVHASDVEDLTLNKEDVVAPKQSEQSPKQIAPHHGLTTWQAVGLWVVVAGVFVSVLPKLNKLRRRARSGMRSE